MGNSQSQVLAAMGDRYGIRAPIETPSARAARARIASSVGTRTTAIAARSAVMGGKPSVSASGASRTKPAVMRTPGTRWSSNRAGMDSWRTPAGFVTAVPIAIPAVLMDLSSSVIQGALILRVIIPLTHCSGIRASHRYRVGSARTSGSHGPRSSSDGHLRHRRRLTAAMITEAPAARERFRQPNG